MRLLPCGIIGAKFQIKHVDELAVSAFLPLVCLPSFPNTFAPSEVFVEISPLEKGH